MSSLVAGTGALVFIGLVRGRLLLAIAVGVSIFGANVTTEVLKRIVFERPDLIDVGRFGNTYPSGHTTVAMSLAVGAVLVAPRRWRGTAAVAGVVYASAVSTAVLRCTIENGALVGNGAIVLHRVVVGSGAIVAANAVVLNDTQVPPGASPSGPRRRSSRARRGRRHRPRRPELRRSRRPLPPAATSSRLSPSPRASSGLDLLHARAATAPLPATSSPAPRRRRRSGAAAASDHLGDGHREGAAEGVAGGGGVDRGDGEGSDPPSFGGRLDVDALCGPSVVTTASTPRPKSRVRRRRVARTRARWGSRRCSWRASSSANSAAGAGLRIVTAPTARARAKASATTSIGISNCASTTRAAGQGGGQQRGVGAGNHDDRVLAGGIDGDQRSARRRPTSRCTAPGRCPRRRRRPRAVRRRRRRRAPSRTCTAPPARRAATTWLSPLPPGYSWYSVPSSVSPGSGWRGAVTTRSRLLLPTTQHVERALEGVPVTAGPTAPTAGRGSSAAPA